MTWHEILMEGKKSNHQVSPESHSKAARSRFREIGLDPAIELVSLRLASTKRVFGIMDEGILCLLWWDPNHGVCPSRKKHT